MRLTLDEFREQMRDRFPADKLEEFARFYRWAHLNYSQSAFPYVQFRMRWKKEYKRYVRLTLQYTQGELR